MVGAADPCEVVDLAVPSREGMTQCHSRLSRLVSLILDLLRLPTEWHLSPMPHLPWYHRRQPPLALAFMIMHLMPCYSYLTVN